jgi:hypothetical protein
MLNLLKETSHSHVLLQFKDHVFLEDSCNDVHVKSAYEFIEGDLLEPHTDLHGVLSCKVELECLLMNKGLHLCTGESHSGPESAAPQPLSSLRHKDLRIPQCK